MNAGHHPQERHGDFFQTMDIINIAQHPIHVVLDILTTTICVGCNHGKHLLHASGITVLKASPRESGGSSDSVPNVCPQNALSGYPLFRLIYSISSRLTPT